MYRAEHDTCPEASLSTTEPRACYLLVLNDDSSNDDLQTVNAQRTVTISQ